MRKGAITRLVVIALIAAAGATAVALFVPWLPPVRSKEAERIDFVMWVVVAICIAVFAVVAAITVYSVMTFRARPDDDSDGPPIHGHTGIEIVWTAVPTVLVTIIAVISAVALAENGHLKANRLQVDVTARAFTSNCLAQRSISGTPTGAPPNWWRICSGSAGTPRKRASMVAATPSG